MVVAVEGDRFCAHCRDEIRRSGLGQITDAFLAHPRSLAFMGEAYAEKRFVFHPEGRFSVVDEAGNLVEGPHFDGVWRWTKGHLEMTVRDDRSYSINWRELAVDPPKMWCATCAMSGDGEADVARFPSLHGFRRAEPGLSGDQLDRGHEERVDGDHEANKAPGEAVSDVADAVFDFGDAFEQVRLELSQRGFEFGTRNGFAGFGRDPELGGDGLGVRPVDAGVFQCLGGGERIEPCGHECILYCRAY